MDPLYLTLLGLCLWLSLRLLQRRLERRDMLQALMPQPKSTGSGATTYYIRPIMPEPTITIVALLPEKEK